MRNSRRYPGSNALPKWSPEPTRKPKHVPVGPARRKRPPLRPAHPVRRREPVKPPSPAPQRRNPAWPKMPPGVHPLAAPRIPTPPFRLPQTPSFNRYTNKLARYALKGVARRLSGPLGVMQDAYDIAQWYDGFSGTK